MSWRDGRSRPVVRKVYFTEQEWGKACALWRAGGGHRTFSAHARELLMWGSVRRVVIPADTDRLAHEVARIGVNVNQVAHRMNARGHREPGDVQEMESLLREAVGILSRICKDAQDRIEGSGWQS